ncbi:MAG TPA: glycosyltransferase family 1 protein [Gemmatimonadaceae bacterium]|nr:glycosyltransferase family 1 protein [Gemmatimonadaceae bacterium]
MKRIGIILGSEPGGGVYQYAQAVLDAVLRMPEDEFELVIAYSNPIWLRHIPPGRAKVIPLEESFRSRIFNRLWHAANLPISLWRKIAASIDPNAAALVRARCELWICPSNESLAFRAQVPALGTIHDLMHIYEPHFPEAGSPEQIREREFHFRETCRWSLGVAVDSDVGRRQLCDAYDISPGRVFVLPYIAPKYIYDSARSLNRQTQNKLPPKYLFYPATFWLHKNHANLFAAIDKLRARYPDIRLVLAGSKQNGYDAALDQVKKLGITEHVQFLGYVPDESMYELYRRSRALIMPSFFGPTNIPQLEAFVAGCPVAVSRVYGVPDQVGDAALLFDPNSVDEIADCIERLWTDDTLCATLAEKGKRKAREWGPEQFSERLQEIVESLTGGARFRENVEEMAHLREVS